ncbi:MAG: phospholipid carrier-dependent glycosyltransferase [Mesorhizobium sp.]|nr:phospholipid carrier-dependent glycosyltransferase [Mesorhizobium sp. M6A.T.Cr.TU.016.01.1.1]RWP54894.1 MAG: phospholipid carrier-dependent glycosyltransferase [Mesorhizobium sp.]
MVYKQHQDWLGGRFIHKTRTMHQRLGMAFVAAWRLKATGSSGCYVSLELLSATLAVAAISALLAFHNIDFPFGVHPDEAIKVGFAFGQPDNYRHPPLLIVLARFAAWLDGAVHDRDFRLAGRTVCAFASVAASVLFYLVLRRYADKLNAFLWGCVFAASPAITIHAHYFKEDAVLIFAICIGLHALVRLRERTDSVDLLYFGFALGLAITAKYVGVANSLVLFVVAITYCKLEWRQAAIVAAVGALTVLAVYTASLLTETGSGLSTILRGFVIELNHVEEGHDLKEWFFEGYGLTHFRYHLIPSLTVPTMVISLGAIAIAILGDRNRAVAAFAGAAIAWLFMLELSPLKIIGSMRYVLPVVIYLLLAAGIACSKAIAPRSHWMSAGLGLLAMAASSHASIEYTGSMSRKNDTRFAAMRFLETRGITRFFADYLMGEPAPETRDYRDLSSVDYLVSQRFARYLRGGGLSEQPQLTYVLAGMFRCLDGHVAAQFSRLYGDYAYVAPTVKIYDLRQARFCIPDPAELGP